MRINKNITKTLCKSLFVSPSMVRFNKEYNSLLNFIFPSKELFILFLEEENFEQQTYLAEKIILRLSYESIFPPPTRLLFNTLLMESEIFGEKKSGHIGRDHFVHLVHLYLLGIYSFFYHQVLSENIFIYFRNIRSATNFYSKNLSKSIVKDFIVGWKYFVLCHDIAYPIEYSLGNNKIKQEKKERYLQSYNNVSKFIGKDLALRSLSKFIGVSKLLINKTEYSFNEIVKPHLKNDSLGIDTSKYMQLEKVYGFNTIRTICSIFKREKIIPVLFDKHSMLPLLVYIYEKEEEKDSYNVFIYETKNYKNTPVLKNIKEVSDAPFNKEFIHSNKFYWIYFVNSEFTIEKIVSQYFPSVKTDSFDKTIDYIHSITLSQYSMVINDASFKQYCFDIYMVLYKLAGYFIAEDITSKPNYTKYLADVISDFSKDIPLRISDIIRQMLCEKLQDIDFEKDMNEKSTIYNVILDYLKLTSVSLEDLAQKVALQLKSNIQLQYQSKRDLTNIRDSLKTQFDKKEINNYLKILIDKDEISYDTLISNSDERLSKIIKRLNKIIEKNKIDSLDNLLKYKPRFKNVPQKFFDHSISSSLIFLSIISVYEQLEIVKEEPFKTLLDVGFGIDTSSEVGYIKHKFETIFSETCFAILIHNIYPEYLETKYKKYRTKLEDNPFSYFCILMDSLQQWDRKFQVNQAYNDLPYNTVSKGFNIEINNNKFRVSEYNSRLDIRRSLNNLKLGIDDYLEKASDLIELNLGEY